MRRFLTIIIILLSFLGSSCSQRLISPKTEEAMLIASGYPRAQPVYVGIDDSFSPSQIAFILDAGKRLENASSNSVKIEFTITKRPGRLVDYLEPKPFTGIFVWNVDMLKELPRSYFQRWNKDSGMTVRSIGATSIFLFDNMPSQYFDAVAVHELFHMLGGEHLKGRTLMNKYVLSLCLTKQDTNYLCSLYDCNPKPECP